MIGLSLRAEGLKDSFRTGWLCGLIAYSACLYWVAVPVHYYGPMPWVLAAPIPLLLGAYFGIYTGLFTMAMTRARSRMHWSFLGLFAGLLWTVLELARSHMLTGFPWISLAQAFSSWPPAIQATQYIGAFALSGALVAITTWLLWTPKHKAAFLPAAITAAILLTLGVAHWQQPLPEGPYHRIGVVQGNIDQSRKWDEDFQNHTVSKYIDLSREALREDEADILIWPETAMPFFFQEQSQLRDRVLEFGQKRQVPILTGAPAYTEHEGSYRLYNRAFLLNEAGEISSYYDKMHLVPFGEYVPMQEWLPFLDKLVPGMGDFFPGQSPDPLRIDDLAMGPLICYEIIFPRIVQERVENEANILINISNDAWFGRSSGPKQHLNQAVLRAVEQNRYLVRSTNTGISGVISPRGQISQATALYEDAAFVSEVQTIEEQTPYSRHRPLLIWIYASLTVLLGLYCLISKEKLQYKIKKV